MLPLLSKCSTVLNKLFDNSETKIKVKSEIHVYFPPTIKKGDRASELQKLAAYQDSHLNRWWLDAQVHGKYPENLVEFYGDKLQKHIAAIVHTPEVRQNFVSQGNEPLANTPDEFAKVMRSDADKWGAIGKKLGVKLD